MTLKEYIQKEMNNNSEFVDNFESEKSKDYYGGKYDALKELLELLNNSEFVDVIAVDIPEAETFSSDFMYDTSYIFNNPNDIGF